METQGTHGKPSRTRTPEKLSSDEEYLTQNGVTPEQMKILKELQQDYRKSGIEMTLGEVAAQELEDPQEIWD